MGYRAKRNTDRLRLFPAERSRHVLALLYGDGADVPSGVLRDAEGKRDPDGGRISYDDFKALCTRLRERQPWAG